MARQLGLERSDQVANLGVQRACPAEVVIMFGDCQETISRGHRGRE